MKKVFLLAILSMCIDTVAFSQFGIKGGYNMSTYSAGDQIGVGVSPETEKNNFTVGVSYDIGLLLGLSLQPEVLYTQRGATFKAINNIVNIEEIDKLNYIDIPLMLKYELPIPIITIFLEAGASYSFLISAKQTDDVNGISTDYDIKSIRTKNDFSYIYGVGLRIFIIELEVREVLGQKSIYTSSNVNATNRGLMATLGIRF